MRRLQGSIALKGAPGHQGDQDRQAQAPQAMHPPGPPHHPALRLSPVLATSQQPDVRPLQHRGQVAVLGLGVPERRAFRQPQFGPAAAGLPLLAGQPVPQRVDQVVVGELVVPPAGPAGGLVLAGRAFGVGRRDQAKLGVEDADQVVEVPGPARRSPRPRAAPASDRIWPLMSVPVSGSRAFSTAWAAFWWRRCSGWPAVR